MRFSFPVILWLSNTFAAGDRHLPDVRKLRAAGMENLLEEPAGREDYNEGDTAFFSHCSMTTNTPSSAATCRYAEVMLRLA